MKTFVGIALKYLVLMNLVLGLYPSKTRCSSLLQRIFIVSCSFLRRFM